MPDQPARPRAAGAVAASIAGVLLVSLVAAVRGSPFHPKLPAGIEVWGPLRAAAEAIGLESLSRDALIGVGIAVLALATAGFLLVVREAWRGGISLRAVVGLSVAFHLLVLLALPLLFSRDVYSYAAYGRISGVYHANPYVAVPADFSGDPFFPLVGEQWRRTPAVYGPAFTMLSAGLTRGIDDVDALIGAFRLIAAAASLATLALVAGIVRRVRPERAAFAAALVGMNPVILFHSVGGGHNDLLVGLAIAAALAFLLSGRELAATAVLTLGALVKATAGLPLLAVVVVAVARRDRGRRARVLLPHLVVIGVLTAIFASPFLQTSDPSLGVVPVAGHLGWLSPVRLFTKTLGGLAAALGGENLRTAVDLLVRLAFWGVFLWATALVARSLLRDARALGPEAQGAAWGWALLAFMLSAPVLLPWYAAWILPLAWLLPRTPRAAAILVSAALALSEVVAEPLSSPGVWEGVTLGLVWAARGGVFALLVWVLADLRRRARAAVPLHQEDEVAAAGRER